MITDENGTDPWTIDKEPPVQAIDDAVAAAVDDERERFIEQRAQMTLQDAEAELNGCEYDYRLAIEHAVATARAYVDYEAQQARTRVRVIEKLMAESEAAVGRKQNEAKRGEVLSTSAAEKIVSGHPEYTAVRDQVAQALNAKTESERRCELLSHTLQNLREIVQSRRQYGQIYRQEINNGQPGSIDLRDVKTRLGLRESERDTIAVRDSRGLDGIERKPMQETRREPSVMRQVLGGHGTHGEVDFGLLDSDDQR